MTRKTSARDQPGVAGAQGRAGDDQLGKRGRRADDLVGERARLALELLHPVAGHLRSIALRVAERQRPDVGDPHVDLAAFAMEGPQDRVVGLLAVDEPLGRLDVPRALDPDDPVARPRQEDHLARLRSSRLRSSSDLDLPAQVARADHGCRPAEAESPRPQPRSAALDRRHDQDLRRRPSNWRIGVVRPGPSSRNASRPAVKFSAKAVSAVGDRLRPILIPLGQASGRRVPSSRAAASP